MMTAQVLYFNDFLEKDPHLKAVEPQNVGDLAGLSLLIIVT